ncbi:MAG: SRPBCC family protein [Gammaproteobacteria bacterium]
MEISNTFSVPVAVAEAWTILTNIEEIVPCMPGAQLVEVMDDSTYKGKVTTRLGPVTMTFNGIAKFAELDEAARRAVVKAKGSDSKGRGAVDADIALCLNETEQNSTNVLVRTDLRLSGSVAQYGRGAGMVTDLANHWMEQFADCLSKRLRVASIEGTTEVESTNPSVATMNEQAAAAPAPVMRIGFKMLWRAILRAIGLAK